VLAEFPTPVQRHIGFAPYQAQMGAKHVDAKPWKTLRRACWKSSRITGATHSGPSTR
jgi:hypothetical protein